MNRILFEPAEISHGLVTVGDARAAHILDVLHGEVGDMLKTGEINGLVGTGEIVAVSGGDVTLRVCHDQAAREPWVDLILAPPRPRVLKRLLPQLATLGVRRIVLVGARKVEKDFWGATLLQEKNYRPLLIDGLMQAGASRLPTIAVRRGFRAFVRDELDVMFPHSVRVVAHPYGAGACACARQTGEKRSLVLAVGPEGGWTDDELAALEAKGFSRFSLGKRILRTDTALIALLAILGQTWDE